jgi:hypothetical protein
LLWLASDSQAVLEVVKKMVRAEDSKDRGTWQANTWPNGRFTFAGERAKHWDDVLFSGYGVWNGTRLGHPTLRVHGNKALVKVEQVSRVYYDRAQGRQYSGTDFVGRDRVELERRNGEWRVLNWFRSGRNVDSASVARRRPR